MEPIHFSPGSSSRGAYVGPPTPGSTLLYAPTERQSAFHDAPERLRLYGGAAGGGKELPVSELVCTPKGWVQIGQLEVGDVVSDPVTGGGTRVIGVYPQGEKPIYRVKCDDGAECRAGLEHLWAYRLSAHTHHVPRSKPSSERSFACEELGGAPPDERWGSLRVGTTRELIGLVDARHRPRIPLPEPVIFTVNGRTGTGGAPEPYLLGLLLGDGSLENYLITTCDDEIRGYLASQGFAPGLENGPDGRPMDWRAKGPIRTALKAWLGNHGLKGCRSWEKFIPAYVSTASLSYRVEFLRGLMDTDGTVDVRGHASYCSTSERLARGVVELVRSLGGKAKVRTRIPTFTHKGERREGRLAYEVSVQLRRTSAAFRLTRKRARCVDSWNGGDELMREVVSIEPDGAEAAVCIRVDSPYSLYITRDYVVTHNSTAIRWELIRQCLCFPGWTALLLRKTRPELQQSHIDKFRHGDATSPPFPRELYTWSEQRKTASFYNGSQLRFDFCESWRDVARYQSDEHAVIGIDELTHHEERVFDYLRSRNRCPRSAQGKPNMIAGTNPGSVGHVWVKDRWILRRKSAGQDSYDATEYGFTPAKVADNPYVNPEYVRDLESLPPAQRAALLDGSWEVTEGMFFDRWDPVDCTYADGSVSLERWWPRWIAADWGYSHDAAVYWGCTDGKTTWVYREFVGNKMEPAELAQRIVDATPLLERGAISDFYLSHDAFNETRGERSIADEMTPILWRSGLPSPTPADRSLENGWAVMRQGIHERTTLIARSCTRLVEAMPAAISDPKRPEVVLKHTGDDPLDAARYLLATRQRLAKAPRDVQIQQRIETMATAAGEDPAQPADHNAAFMRTLIAHAQKPSLPFLPRASGRRWLRAS